MKENMSLIAPHNADIDGHSSLHHLTVLLVNGMFPSTSSRVTNYLHLTPPPQVCDAHPSTSRLLSSLGTLHWLASLQASQPLHASFPTGLRSCGISHGHQPHPARCSPRTGTVPHPPFRIVWRNSAPLNPALWIGIVTFATNNNGRNLTLVAHWFGRLLWLCHTNHIPHLAPNRTTESPTDWLKGRHGYFPSWLISSLISHSIGEHWEQIFQLHNVQKNEILRPE